MYTLMIKSSFIANHFLVGKDFGKENFPHSHLYSLEVEIEGNQLDSFNYLIDIIDAKNQIDQLVELYKNKTLNDLSEFANQNPSLELFAKILWQKIQSLMQLPVGFNIIVRLWEDDIARASYRE